jgi:hypothetical protein
VRVFDARASSPESTGFRFAPAAGSLGACAVAGFGLVVLPRVGLDRAATALDGNCDARANSVARLIHVSHTCTSGARSFDVVDALALVVVVVVVVVDDEGVASTIGLGP